MPAPKPKVFLDADVLFAGAASSSTSGASYIVLRMAELTLIECITSEQVITETERNLSEKLPNKLPAFHELVNHCLRIVPDPSWSDLSTSAGQAEKEDLPILKPGDFLLAVREWMGMLSAPNPL